MGEEVTELVPQLVMGLMGLGHEVLGLYYSGQALGGLVQTIARFEILHAFLCALRAHLQEAPWPRMAQV